MAVDFTTSRITLMKLVERVKAGVEKRNTIPILSNVVINVGADGRLSVMATDLDVWIAASAPAGSAETGAEGKTSVPAHLLYDILRKADSDKIAIESDGTIATLSAGRARFKLNELPAEDFPEMPLAEMASEFELEAADLKRIPALVAFAISTEETRYYLNGIYLEAEELDEQHYLSAVATDGHRLSKLRLPVSEEIADLPGIIVPRKTVQLFEKIADACDPDEAISIGANATFIDFQTHNLHVRSKLIDGTYPDYRRVIPASNSRSAEVAPENLAAAVARVSSVSAERGRGLRMEFQDGSLVMRMESPDAGEATDEIEVGNPTEIDEFVIGFNSRYLQEALATFAGDMVRLTLQDPGSPALLIDPEDDNRKVVLMPMRV